MTISSRTPARVSSGRVAALAAASAALGALPIPVAPRRVIVAMRGSLAHDLAAAHGLALTHEGREILGSTAPLSRRTGLVVSALEFVATRALLRLSPYAIALSPVRAYYETLAFGRLFDRYLDQHRGSGKYADVLRIDGREAEVIRSLIERAALAVVNPSLEAEKALEFRPPEDYRNTTERFVDAVVMGAAKLPETLGLRLDAAFDALMVSP